MKIPCLDGGFIDSDAQADWEKIYGEISEDWWYL